MDSLLRKTLEEDRGNSIQSKLVFHNLKIAYFIITVVQLSGRDD